MICMYRLRSSATIILGFCLVLLTGQAAATSFEAPKLDGFNLHAERDADGDKDGVNETHIKQYFNTSGDSIVSMTTRDKTWAWSMSTRNNESGDKNYVIRDSDCDGQFDQVYGLDDDFYVPNCLKK